MTNQRLDVRLTFRDEDDTDEDLLVRASPGTTVEDLIAALRRRYGGAVGPVLHNLRSGPMAPRLALSHGLRDGDVVTDAPPDLDAQARSGSGLELWVVGGPAAGRRVPLPDGESVIGRGGASSIRIGDPSLSREHLRIVVTAGSARVGDDDSANGTAVDGRRLQPGEEIVLSAEQHVEAGRSLLIVCPALHTDDTIIRRLQARIEFNRPPREAEPYVPPVVDVKPPPSKPTGTRLPLAASLAPLVLGIVMFALTKQPAMLLFSALTPVMALSTFLSDRRGGRKSYAKALAAYHERARGLQGELEVLRGREILARRRASPDPATLATRAALTLPTLWERSRDDDDFLTLRLGTADQPAAFTVTFRDGGEPEERKLVDDVISEGAALPAVPVEMKLLEKAGVGLIGDADRAEALARWLIIQAAVLHSPRDLLIFAALSEPRAAQWNWLTWLPHAAPTRTTVDHANIAVGEASGQALLTAIADVAGIRREESQQRRGARMRGRPVLLVLVDEAVGPPRALVDELLVDAPDTDIAFVWLGRKRRELPGGCRVVAELESERAAADVSWPRDGVKINGATPDGIDVSVADEVARALAPVRDVTQGRSAASLPRSAALLDVLGEPGLDAEAVLERWHNAQPGSLPAPLGASPNGRYTLDLRRDGPHALVAGTTGAGKSELLQTLVAGMAVSQPPTRVSFLFVDYKGGAAFKECVGLPHAAGMVTDLDEHLTRRALLSLNAELRRREHLLNDAGVASLLELERRDPDNAPPSLVIVIDEFAALKTEVPEFVDGVVDIAQRGRSLGVHLILATQRPGGIVSDNIRANTTLRIALRVQQAAESDDVIGDKSAARISKALPGRAFARTGHSELTEFQAAYAGARTPVPSTEGEIALRRLHLGEPVAGPGGDDESGYTDLERIVAAVKAATAADRLTPPREPWKPELDEVIPLDELEEPDEPGADQPHVVPIGTVDEPRRQRQRTWALDLERDGSVFIYGTGGAGKTTLLRTIAVQLARRSDPRHLHLYGMDLAGHGLSVLEELPHCGAVIVGEDEERVSRLFTMLRRTIDERGRRFAEAGVATLTEYRSVTPPDRWPARIVVLLDGYAAFTEAFQNVNLGVLTQRLPRIIAEGRAAGVHVVATADRRNAIPHQVSPLVSQRIVLRLADEDEYATLGLDRKGVAGAQLPAGRGFVDETLELQVALVGEHATGDRPAVAIREEAARMRAAYGATQAPAIPSMPAELPRAALPVATDPARPVLGLEELELQPVRADLTESPFFVCGPYRSGRTTALETVALSLRAADPALEMHLLAPRRSALTQLEATFTSIARGSHQSTEALQRVLEQVLMRSPESAHPLLVLVIDDVDELATDPAAENTLSSVVRRARDVNVRVVAACELTNARGFNSAIRELRKDGNGVLLTPNPEVDGDLLGARLPRRSAFLPPPGRGFLISSGMHVLVQIAA